MRPDLFGISNRVLVGSVVAIVVLLGLSQLLFVEREPKNVVITVSLPDTVFYETPFEAKITILNLNSRFRKFNFSTRSILDRMRAGSIFFEKGGRQRQKNTSIRFRQRKDWEDGVCRIRGGIN